MCRVHEHVAVGRDYVAAMLWRAGPTGKIPDHFAATVRLVDQRLELALAALPGVDAARPDLSGQTAALRQQLEAARASLPARDSVDLFAAQAAMRTLDACWQTTGGISDDYFGRPPQPAALDKVRDAVRALPPAERERYIATLRP